MAQIQQFEDIIVWQKARILTTDIYDICKSLKDYSYKDQIQRASVSTMNNIVKGFERKSNKEFKQFLFIAKGSCGEVKSLILLGEDLKYINKQNAVVITEYCIKIARMISGFIKKL